MRVLVVEDEQRLANAIAYILKKDGYAVDAVYDGISGLDLAGEGIYDVIILDRMLPGKDGTEVLKELRRNQIKTPTIFLTAKDTIQDRVEGLDAGADDYLVKPFSNDELRARVRALSRRSDQLRTEQIYQLGGLSLDGSKLECAVGSVKNTLSAKESQLLELFIRNAGQTLTKEQILNRVWGYENDVEISIVELYVFYLRKKLHLKKPV